MCTPPRHRPRRTSSTGPASSCPAASTRPCAPSGRSAARRGSWSGARARTCIDADGRRYVDLVASWGPLILGHAHPAVVAALVEAAAHGTSFGTPTPREVELAAEIVDRTPVEQVRLVNSGTEATMTAIRLARGRHRPPEDREVRRLLPRSRRRAARRRRLGRGHPRPARLARGHRGRGERDDRAALQRPRRGRAGAARQRRGRDHHRGGGRQHGRGAARPRASTPAWPSSPTSTARCSSSTR